MVFVATGIVAGPDLLGLVELDPPTVRPSTSPS
jgi:hypothetical protein